MSMFDEQKMFTFELMACHHFHQLLSIIRLSHMIPGLVYSMVFHLKVFLASLISNMICMNYDHNKKFGLLKFHLGYGKFYFNSPKGYNRKIINAQTVQDTGAPSV